MADPMTEIDVDLSVQEVLLAASQHDTQKLRRLLRANDAASNPANVKDPETGYSPLHAAIAACEPDVEEDVKTNGAPNGVQTNGEEQTSEQESTVQAAVQTVRLLLQEGAIWNDLDLNNETPGCIARRLGLTELYEMIVDAGVRAELLLNRLDGYEQLSDEEMEEDQEEEQEQQEITDAGASASNTADDESVPQLVDSTTAATTETTQTAEAEADPSVTSSRYLNSDLTFQQDRLLDQDQNGVMMAWETEIMAKSAKQLLPTPGLRVLNVGHGMGIVDGFIQEQAPLAHHIIEAHPGVVAEMKRKGWHEKPGVTIHEGKWQDILPGLVAEGVMFDAIYYDTFAESYADFRDFFTEQVIGVLEQEGKWSFFNGMGADRQISYDVYQKVVEMDIFEAGFDVEWEEIDVPKLEGEWNGVRRPYWSIDKYRLPLCKYMD
ncbi:protein-arginine N5-methyltransferase [Aspergillus mulundensis]|uniref:Arginine N-methyltransferase 2 n=1 Tax=Aspergillus mulundensis TaxID=1810919 RepID=A0A3D8SW98_9EURO|nr:Protein arginine N-methyltransferase 2 [Aspergillus mulundensis]RDW90592.1 Protein arginine N-methyltransferase 2 [Aspergillus mulundensis]